MTQLDDVVIVSAVRTAIGDFGGVLKNFRAPDLAAIAMKAAIDRVGIDNLSMLCRRQPIYECSTNSCFES